MILKGNQRAGGRQMALHLMNSKDNEHVTLHQIRGFIAQDVLGALNEAYAQSKGTQCKQFMYSLSLNPPLDKNVPAPIFENALKRIEKKLGLENQPRIVVFHEKNGRRHAHCVWSRIDITKMKAVNISHDRRKLKDIAKQLFLEQGWTLPQGFIDRNAKNPLNYTKEEWQQAARIDKNPKQIKSTLQECWAISDSRKAFEHALQERGYYLAQGDRRGYVAVDIHGEVYSLTRQLGQKTETLQKRLGSPKNLPGAEDIKKTVAGRLSKLFCSYSDELIATQKRDLTPLLRTKHTMTQCHRADRTSQNAFHDKRWQAEELQRSSRVRHGFKGLWDKLNGKYWKTRKQNEQETKTAHQRDRQEKEALIKKQLLQRQKLQSQFIALREKHEKERINLMRTIPALDKDPDQAKKTKDINKNSDFKPPSHDTGFEPEI